MSVHNVQSEIEKSSAVEAGGSWTTLLPNGSRRFVRRVLLVANETVPRGYGVCYRRTFGTATDADESRDWRVELPARSNHMAFAGVAVQAYASSTSEQWILIYEPPSVCEIFAASFTLLEDRTITCQIDDEGGATAGRFIFGGFSGRGTARLMQEGAGTALLLAELLDGEESGLIDFHPQEFNTASDGGARTTTKYGTTIIEGGDHNTDITTTLADGIWIGQQKMYRHKPPNPLSNDLVVTVTTGKQLNGTTTLATITIDAINEFALLEWNGLHWNLLAHDATIA